MLYQLAFPEDEISVVPVKNQPMTQDMPFPAGIGGDIAGDLTIEEIPALTWAIFKCTGAMPNAIQELWHRIYSNSFRPANTNLAEELISSISRGRYSFAKL